MHAASESVLRRILLVGLRRNSVRYSDAQIWLHDNDDTPNRSNYEPLFNRLFAGRVTFAQVTAAGSRMGELWELWLDFAKIVRNHVSHGNRKYDEPWLQCAVEIDQAFIMEICTVVGPYLGGSVGNDLRKLLPRLSMGRAGVSIPTLLGMKGRKPRPTASLQSAQTRFAALGVS